MNTEYMQKNSKQMQPDDSRRRFCKAGLVGITSVIGLSALGGGAIFLGAPAVTNTSEGKWIEAGSMDDFSTDTFTQVILEYPIQDGWMYATQRMLAYVKRNGNDFIAFSAVCAHLGCNVRFEEDRNEFVCPCHAGVYDAEGKNIAGPPPRPLTRLPVKVENDIVSIYNREHEEKSHG